MEGQMKIGLIGLGKMGSNMAQRLIRDGHEVVGFARNPDTVEEAQKFGVQGSSSVADLISQLAAPRVVWVMVPSGVVTDEVLDATAALLTPGDILIDGGNTNYKDSIRHAAESAKRGLGFLDVGTSGGIWGLQEGYSLMIGGKPEIVEKMRPIFETLAPSPTEGWGHVGPAGSGHFTKMIHNGIEYGMMQAFAEGFEILHEKKEFDLDLHQITKIWQKGSVVRSWLLDLTARVFEADTQLDGIEAFIADSGEGRWTVFEAIDLNVAAPVITASLQRRIRSRQAGPFSDKLVAAMRNQFGGHAIVKKE
jgi:6-phosphogluconate dehydrogenase